jgi:hypothetical protein
VAADVDATIDMMVKIAGSEVELAEVEDWIGGRSTRLLLANGESRSACQSGADNFRFTVADDQGLRTPAQRLNPDIS